MTGDPIIELGRAIRAEAAREAFPIDEPVYVAAGSDPLEPIVCHGDLASPVAIFGRDLGRDEVIARQPLIGAAGKLVRTGLCRAVHGRDPRDDAERVAAGARALLLNTVPYKPPGNKAYSPAVKARFRPMVAALLGTLWTGDTIITLGNEAFEWFAPYAPDPGAFAAFWDDEERRYGAALTIELRGEWAGRPYARTVHVAPLPHPSPLNARWYRRFPALLDARLANRWPPAG